MAITGITDATRAEVARSLTGKRRDIAETLFSLVLLLTLIIALAVLIVLLFNVARTAVPLLAHQGGRVLGNDYSALPQNAGIRSGLIGSIYLMIFVILLAVPLGIGAAIYMEEYARDTRLARFINTNIRNLAGVPAIVYGILGFAVFAQLLGSVTGPKVAGLSLLTGGLTISLMVLPIVIITTQEALRSVPTGIREGGFGVGATRWEVIRSHVLPNAAPGILTGSVLAMARALGETAPLIMVGAVTGFL